jgi:hypothetical protein
MFIVKLKYILGIQSNYREFDTEEEAMQYYNNFGCYCTIEQVSLFKQEENGDFKLLLQKNKMGDR